MFDECMYALIVKPQKLDYLLPDVEHSSAPQAGLYAAGTLPDVQYEGFEPSPYEQEEYREDEFAQVSRSISTIPPSQCNANRAK